ncbi:MAG: fimbrillin family protein [Prevotella sp.]|nr:fimbrillin family protein [Prevotella sp.]
MKTNKLFLGMAAIIATLAFTGCSSNEMEPLATVTPAPKNSDINLASEVNATRSTEALQLDKLSTDTKVGVFGVSGNDFVKNGENNQYSVDADQKLSTDNKMYWPTDNEATVSLYGYAPYSESWKYETANPFTVSTNQSTSAGYLASDLLYAKALEKAQTTDAITLNFNHMLSRINLTITKGSSATVNLKDAEIYITGTKPGTTLNPSTGEIGAASGDAANINVGKLASDAGSKLYGIVVPQALTADTKFVKIVTSDGKSLVATLGKAVTLKSGYAYNYEAKIGAGNDVELTLGAVTLTAWATGEDLGSAEAEEVEYEYSPTSFVAMTSSQSASYADGTYSWTAASNNLMTILEFPLSDGNTLANFKTLEVTTSNLSENGKWRMGYVLDGGSYTNFDGFSKDEAGKIVIDLTALTIDLSKVTKIQIGGATGKTPDSQTEAVNEGSIKISPSDVVLKGYVATTGGGGSSGGGDSNTLTATFGTPGSNATYSGTTYTWTGSSSNLMTVFEFSNGELANYATLTFAFSDLVDGPVRIGYYVGSDFTEFKNNAAGDTGFYSAGTKTIDLSIQGVDLSTVTKISFGGKSSGGSCTIKASDMKLTKASE